MTDLAGAHVLVTGGSSGIGAAAALEALRRGARVSLVARDTERLAAAEDRLEAAVGDATRVAAEPADVTVPEAFERALALLTAQFGPVDVLLASAGAAEPGLFELSDLAVLRSQMELNYFGTVHAIRAVLPSMVERRRGHLALVSSTAGVIGVYGYSAYGPAKFAIRGLAETLRTELKPHGIVVTCAYPPDTDTPGFAYENERKPPATASMSAKVKVRSAEAVGRAIIRGVERDRMVVTVDPTTRALAAASGLLGPVARRVMDRHVRRTARLAPPAGDGRATPGASVRTRRGTKEP